MSEAISDHDRLQATIAVTRACTDAGRLDLLEGALRATWFDGKAAGLAWFRLRVEGPKPAKSAAVGGSGFGPDPATRDALAEAVRTRFAAMAKGSA